MSQQRHLSRWIEQCFRCMRTCNTLVVGVCRASNLHLIIYHYLQLFLTYPSLLPYFPHKPIQIITFDVFKHYWLTLLMFDCLSRFLTYAQRFRSCLAIPQPFSNSAAIQSFCSIFIDLYVPRVILKKESQGHVGMKVLKVPMLLVRSTTPRTPPVNVDQTSVNKASSNGAA